MRHVLHRGAGMMALLYAIKEGFKQIYLIGHDFNGLDGKLNNVYADTHAYGKSTDKQLDYVVWSRSIEELVKDELDKTFYRVIIPGLVKPSNLNALPNFKYMDMTEFLTMFN